MKSVILALIALVMSVTSPLFAQSIQANDLDTQSSVAAPSIELDALGFEVPSQEAAARWSSCQCQSSSTACSITCPTGQSANCVKSPGCSCYCR